MDRGDSIRLCSDYKPEAMQAEIDKLLSIDAVRVVEESPRQVVSSMFAVPRNDGRIRPVINLKTINPFVPLTHFKLEDLQAVREIIRPNDWMCTVDLSDAFHHVSLHPDHRRFFRFRFDKTLYEWQAMPFGYKDAPRIFTMVMKVVARRARQEGIRLVVYLDDILVLSDTQSGAARDTKRLQAILEEMGFSINLKKSQLIPAQSRIFLGFIIDSIKMVISLQEKTITRVTELSTLLLARTRSRRSIRLKVLQRVIGKLASLAPGLEFTRPHLNLLFEHLSVAERRGHVTLSLECLPDLQWWQDQVKRLHGRPIRRPAPSHTFTTDASEFAWGAWVQERGVHHPARGDWPRAWEPHSNVRELTAIKLGLLSFIRSLHWKHCDLVVRTDNQVSMAYVNRQGGRVPALSRVAEEIHSICAHHHLRLQAEYIPGTENTVADTLSRVRSDWSSSMLSKPAFQLINDRWGPHTLDAFASAVNTQLPRYVSYHLDHQCEWVDFFSRPFPTASERENLWIFPPFKLIGRVLAKALDEKAPPFTMLIPVWLSQPWWPTLTAMMISAPVFLPVTPTLLSRPESFVDDSPPPAWHHLAVRLSGSPQASSDFRARLRTDGSSLIEAEWIARHSRDTTRLGWHGGTSAQAKAQIRSICRLLLSPTSSPLSPTTTLE